MLHKKQLKKSGLHACFTNIFPFNNAHLGIDNLQIRFDDR